MLLGSAEAAAQRTFAPRAQQELRTHLERARAERHLSPQSIDVDAIVAEYARRYEAGASKETLDVWLGGALQQSYLAFAPVGARHRAKYKYRFPFDELVPRYMGQGVGGSYSHDDEFNRYSFDFIMPIGTPVLAARPGTVVRMVDGFTECCLEEERAAEANTVVVLHKDGSFAHYVHLKPGIPVKEGQKIKAGRRVAYSGNTGYAAKPHLHFSVHTRREDGGSYSVPILFLGDGNEGYVPEPETFCGRTPATNADLRVSVGGIEVRPEQPLITKWGETVHLRVEWRSPSGRFRDVTADPRVRYESLTPWHFDVGRTGRVRLETDPVWNRMHRVGTGGVQIIFRDPDRGLLGIAQVMIAATPPVQAQPAEN